MSEKWSFVRVIFISNKNVISKFSVIILNDLDQQFYSTRHWTAKDNVSFRSILPQKHSQPQWEFDVSFHSASRNGDGGVRENNGMLCIVSVRASLFFPWNNQILHYIMFTQAVYHSLRLNFLCFLWALKFKTLFHLCRWQFIFLKGFLNNSWK